MAAQFANVPAQAIEREIEQAMARLIAFLGFDRSSLLFPQPDETVLQVLCSVAAAPFEAVPSGMMTIHVPWLLVELRAGRSPRMSNLPEGLPPEAIEERRFVVAQGIRS